MNTQLQKIIEEIEDEYLQAEQQEKHNMMINSEMHLWYEGYKLACKLHAERLTKILNEGSVAASEPVLKQCGCWLSTPCDCGE